MTELEYIKCLRMATKLLSNKEIDLENFEELCKNAATRWHGPPPEGREYVVGVIDDRLVVGHAPVVPSKPMHLKWKHKTISSSEQEHMPKGILSGNEINFSDLNKEKK